MPEVYQRTDIYDLLEDENKYNLVKNLTFALLTEVFLWIDTMWAISSA